MTQHPDSPDSPDSPAPLTLTGTLSEALSTLSDRGLRRLFGSNTFLRGLEYFRRRVLEDVQVASHSATATVRGGEGEPIVTRVELGPEGIQSTCNGPTCGKLSRHCRHAAALVISVRDQARAERGKREPGPPPAPSAPSQALPPHPVGEGRRLGRHERRARASGSTFAAAPMAAGLPPAPQADATLAATGMGAWLPPEGHQAARRLEFRIHVRSTGLTVTVLDAQARQPLLPSQALAWQALHPTPERDALRLLARFETGNVRHPTVELRGEDAAELLPHLEPVRVLLEPALMQLRFEEEPLRPRFDLESFGGDTIVAKASFERPSDKRRFPLSSGVWLEGWPCWHLDTQVGVARRIDKRVSPAALRRLMRVPSVAEPMNQLARIVMQEMPRIAFEVGAELPELSQVVDLIDMPPVFRLRAGGSLVAASVQLYAAYGAQEVQVRADGISLPLLFQPGSDGARRPRCIRVDIPAQQEAAERLTGLGLAPDESGEAFVARGDAAIQFWSEGLGQLPEEWDLFVPDDLVGTQVRTKPVAAFAKVTSGMDWLSVKLSFESEGAVVSRDELRRCLSEGRRYVRLDDGSFAPFDANAVRQLLDRELELVTAAGKSGKIPLAHAGRIQELLQAVGESNVSANARQLFAKLSDIEQIEAVKKPRALKATLRPYQEAGLSWLRFVHDIASGGVLADDMGLGKTVQTIALLLSVRQDLQKEGQTLRTLIVAPTSVVRNWERELERFAPTLPIALWHGADRHEHADTVKAAEVVITSYALLRRDEEFLSSLDLTYAILDEAQHIKNPLSATAASAKRLRARRRLALTGTPIENRLSEIWSIFDFVSPQLLGSLEKFEARFGKPIESGDYKVAQRLRAIIHPFILRRTKQEVAKDLPEKIETDQVCELLGEQKSLYQQVAREVRAQVLGEVERVGLAKSHIQILAGLTRLRQAACDPRLLGLPREFGDDDSGKLVALRELVANAVEGGHKVLVFSQFVMMLKLIERALKEDGVPYEYLDGSTKDRMERVERFQEDPAVPVFLISLKAGGTGLNLTAADTVIHFDPWWNPAVEQQATDRAHRIGQSKVVTVYRLVASGTIEEKILQLKAKKKDIAHSVLSEDAGGMKKLTKADLDELFSAD